MQPIESASHETHDLVQTELPQAVAIGLLLDKLLCDCTLPGLGLEVKLQARQITCAIPSCASSREVDDFCGSVTLIVVRVEDLAATSPASRTSQPILPIWYGVVHDRYHARCHTGILYHTIPYLPFGTICFNERIAVA